MLFMSVTKKLCVSGEGPGCGVDKPRNLAKSVTVE